jgi:hypothetical protein
VFSIDGAIPNMAASATQVSLLASTWSRMSIEEDFDSLIVMKNELQPETKVKLFASFICSRFMKQH